MTVHADEIASRALHLSSQAWGDLMSTVQIFQANVNRGDLAAAAAERERMHSLVDDYADQFLIAGRAIQDERST